MSRAHEHTPEELLLAAARRLIAAGEAVTMSELAKSAGLSRATLYRMVPDREALAALLAKHGLSTPDDAAEERILRAVRTVLETRGFVATTMEEIAREAGIGVATLYRRYLDREGLLRAFIEAIPARRKAWTLEPTPDTNVEADLSVIAAGALRALNESRGLFRVALGAPPEAKEFMRRIHDANSGTTAALTRYFEHCAALGLIETRDPVALARTFTSMLFGLSVLRPELEGSAAPDPEETGRYVAQTIFRGIAPKAKKSRT